MIVNCLNKLVHTYIALAMLVMLAVSCSSDERAFLAVDDDMGKMITAGLDGDVVAIHVRCNGKWTASLPHEAEEWVQLGRDCGEGDGTVVLAIDPNYTGVGRDALLTLCCGSETREVMIHQNLMLNGEDPGNSADYSTIALDKGLGQGYDLVSQKKKRQLINLKALRKLLSGYGPVYSDLMQQSPFSAMENDVYIGDSVEVKQDSVNVGVHLSVGYAVFNVDVEGAYSSGEFRQDSSLCMNVGVKYPMYVARTDCWGIKSYFDETYSKQQAGNTLSEEEQLLNALYTVEFKTMRQEISNQIRVNSDFVSNIALQKSLMEMVNRFGMAVTSETLLGGSLALRMSVDTAYTSLHAGIPNIQVKTALNTGLFNINAGAEGNFLQETKEILCHSGFHFKVLGGTNQAQSDLCDCLMSNRTDDVQAAISRWIESLNLSDLGKTNNAELIDCHLFPLWMFFDDADRECVKKFIVNNCTDKTGALERMVQMY